MIATTSLLIGLGYWAQRSFWCWRPAFLTLRCMSSELSSTKETSRIAPAPGSRVIEGSIEENLIPQYPPAPIPPTEAEQQGTDLATFIVSID